MVLGQVFNSKTIIMHLESEDKDEAFEEMIEQLVGHCPQIDREKVLKSVREREAKMTTGVMHNIAVPHGRCDAVCDVTGIIGISKQGVDFDSLDKAPVHLVFMIISPQDNNEFHLRVLKRLAQVLNNPSFYNSIMEQTDPTRVYDMLCKYEDLLSSGE